MGLTDDKQTRELQREHVDGQQRPDHLHVPSAMMSSSSQGLYKTDKYDYSLSLLISSNIRSTVLENVTHNL